jgi:hypothetical protein
LWYCRDGLGEAYDGDIAFANALETFGGGHDDPISVAVGGSSIQSACYNLQNKEQRIGFYLTSLSILVPFIIIIELEVTVLKFSPNKPSYQQC